jgi:hypothetical protein
LRSSTASLAILLCFLSAYAERVGQDWENERFAAAGVREQKVEAFFTTLKEAVASNDKKAVASLVSYPVTATLAFGRRTKIRSKTDFIRFYDQIFHDDFKQLIADTKLNQLWARTAGVAMPRGEIWFAGVQRSPRDSDQYQIKIIAINGLIR